MNFLAEKYSCYCQISCFTKGTYVCKFRLYIKWNANRWTASCKYIFFDIMKLKIPFLLNCESTKYLAKLFSLSIDLVQWIVFNKTLRWLVLLKNNNNRKTLVRRCITAGFFFIHLTKNALKKLTRLTLQFSFGVNVWKQTRVLSQTVQSCHLLTYSCIGMPAQYEMKLSNLKS